MPLMFVTITFGSHVSADILPWLLSLRCLTRSETLCVTINIATALISHADLFTLFVYSEI